MCIQGSPPSRRRGLKRRWEKLIFSNFIVASFAEAWIEKLWTALPLYWFPVASFAEAWIEKSNMICACDRTISSPPSRRRGLKIIHHHFYRINGVASFAKAWIEKAEKRTLCTSNKGRLLRGGVD